jgi:hypothetical protein
MTDASYDQNYWEELWSKTLREHADKVAHRPPNAHLTAEVASLRPGLDWELAVAEDRPACRSR